MLVAVAGPAQQLRELSFDLHPGLDRFGNLRLSVRDLLAKVVQRRLAGIQLAPDHARGVARFGQLPLELGDALVHGLGRAVLLLDGRGRFLRPAYLGDDLSGFRQLLHQLAALLSQLRELGVLLLELVVQLLFLAGGRVQLLLGSVHFLVCLGHLLVAGLDVVLQLVLALGEHPDQIVLFLQLPRDRVALRSPDGHAVLELLDLALQGLRLAPAVGLDRPLHPLALALQLRGRVVRLLFVQLLLQLFQLVLALLEERADLLRVRPGGGGRVVRGLLLHLLHLHLELAVLLLEEGDLAA